MLSAISQEGTVVDAKGSDDASRGFARVFFGPPASEISAHSSALDTAAADPGAQVDDPEVSFTWKVPLTSLQLGGFKCAGKASDPDYPASALAVLILKHHCKRS